MIDLQTPPIDPRNGKPCGRLVFDPKIENTREAADAWRQLLDLCRRRSFVLFDTVAMHPLHYFTVVVQNHEVIAVRTRRATLRLDPNERFHELLAALVADDINLERLVVMVHIHCQPLSDGGLEQPALSPSVAPHRYPTLPEAIYV